MRGLPTLRSAAAACPHALPRGDASNLARILLGEPEANRVAGPGRDTLRSAQGCGDAENSGEAAAGCDAVDGVAVKFRKPQVAIRPGRNAERSATRGDGELGDAATCGEGPDRVPS